MYPVYSGEIETFRNTILFGSSGSRLLMNNTVLLDIEFPFECDILATIVGAKNSKFSAGLTFNFLVPGFEDDESFTLLSKVIHPRVAS